MSYPVIDVTDKQFNMVLSYKEGHFLDLKSIDITPAKLTKTISAFANADGGELFIGVDEVIEGDSKKRVWRGFPDVEAANAHVQVFEEFFPLGQYFSYEFLSVTPFQGLVLKVEIGKTRDIIKASDGKVYLRRSAQSLPVTTDEALSRLRMDKGITTFVTETVDTDMVRISNSLVVIKFLLDVVPTAEPVSWLKKQELIKGDKPTVAGILLFDDEPQAVLPKRCGIKIYRYKTTKPTREALAFDPITIEGCLYDQIKTAVEKTIEIIQDIKILKPFGLEQVRYPYVTLHEIITNAVLHRDYSLTSDVHIRIFDNRIEVESPGKLPGSVTIKNILHSQLARNGSLVRLINKCYA